MATLEKRIDALEQAGAVGVQPVTNLVRFFTPGQLETEIEKLHTKAGQNWARQEGETQQELIARATREVTRTAWKTALLFEGAAT